MNPDLILQVVSGIIGLVTVLVGAKIRNYFQSQDRRTKADLIKTFALAALSYAELQKGVSVPVGDVIRYAIDELYTKLINYGFNKSNAMEVARSAIAAAAAERGYPLREVEPLVH